VIDLSKRAPYAETYDFLGAQDATYRWVVITDAALKSRIVDWRRLTPMPKLSVTWWRVIQAHDYAFLRTDDLTLSK
jgi:hypothetical protein